MKCYAASQILVQNLLFKNVYHMLFSEKDVRKYDKSTITVFISYT